MADLQKNQEQPYWELNEWTIPGNGGRYGISSGQYIDPQTKEHSFVHTKFHFGTNTVFIQASATTTFSVSAVSLLLFGVVAFFLSRKLLSKKTKAT